MGVRRAEHIDLARAEAARAASVRPEQAESAAAPESTSAVSQDSSVAVLQKPSVAVPQEPSVAVLQKPSVAVLQKPSVAVPQDASPAEVPVAAHAALAESAQPDPAHVTTVQLDPTQADAAHSDSASVEKGQADPEAEPEDKQRAARSYQPRARRRRSRGSFLLSLLLFVLTVVASYELFVLARNFTQDSRTFPVARVVIEGKLKYISEEEIANTVGKLVGGKNLVTLDLSRLHNALVQMPWMAKVAVVKRFPDTIAVQVVEHSPSARWRTSGVYDSTTDSVFYPDLRGIDLPLVILSAPHDSLAGDLYQHAAQFIALCARTPYFIKEVHLDAVRGYRIRLEGDVWLILGRETSANLPLIRLKRFLLAFPQTQLKLSEISYVDLRYDNGFAVGERDPNFNGITGTSTPPPAADAAAEAQNVAP